MLSKVCTRCPYEPDCVEHGACLHEVIAEALGLDEDVAYSDYTEFDTEYTDAANITDTILPHIPDEDQAEED